MWNVNFATSPPCSCWPEQLRGRRTATLAACKKLHFHFLPLFFFHQGFRGSGGIAVKAWSCRRLCGDAVWGLCPVRPPQCRLAAVEWPLPSSAGPLKGR